MVAEAKTKAERIREDSERVLVAATQRRDSINAQLTNVRQMLATLSGGAIVNPIESESEPAKNEPAESVPAQSKSAEPAHVLSEALAKAGAKEGAKEGVADVQDGPDSVPTDDQPKADAAAKETDDETPADKHGAAFRRSAKVKG